MARVSSAVTARGLAYISKTLAPAAAATAATAASSSSSASAPPAVVLFAHANGFCKECFLPLWEELAAAATSLSRPVRLVAFDFSGHGDSRPVSGPDCDWRRVAAGDVRAMLEELGGGGGDAGDGEGPQPCCLGVGHSLGAAAMVMAELEEAAAQHEQQHQQQHQQPGSGHHHQSTRPLFNGGLVLIEPILLAPDGDRSMIHPLADRALKRRTSWPSRTAAREYLQPRPVFSAWDPRALDAYVEHALAPAAADAADGSVTLKCRPETEAGFYRGAGPSVWPDLHRLGHHAHAPVLFLAGAASDHMRVIIRERGSAEGVARELAGMMGRGTRLHVEPGASHFLPMERPRVVAELLLQQLLQALGPPKSTDPRSLL